MNRKRTHTRMIGGKGGSTCRELLTLINEYVDGEVDPSLCRGLERHLAKCNPCRVVVDKPALKCILYLQSGSAE